VTRTKLATESGVRNTIAVIATALLPSAVVGLPVICAMLLPHGWLLGLRHTLPLLWSPIGLRLLLGALLWLLLLLLRSLAPLRLLAAPWLLRGLAPLRLLTPAWLLRGLALLRLLAPRLRFLLLILILILILVLLLIVLVLLLLCVIRRYNSIPTASYDLFLAPMNSKAAPPANANPPTIGGRGIRS
jgi:hypothetical protein